MKFWMTFASEVDLAFIEMEKKTTGLTDAQKLPFKDEYGKEQLALE